MPPCSASRWTTWPTSRATTPPTPAPTRTSFVYEAEGLKSNAAVYPFDFHIKKGEVTGFTGLLGSGRWCVRAIFGADRVTGGKVKKGGKDVKITKPLDAMKKGIAYLPEDRKGDGIIGSLSVRENIILAAQVLRGFLKPFSKAETHKIADEYIKLLDIKTASADTPIASLSGGNQQKRHPRALALHAPGLPDPRRAYRAALTSAPRSTSRLVLQLASEGMSVTFISSELDEMIRTCSRLVVMRDRHVVGELTGEDLHQNKIMSTIAGGEAK